ncbi:hypothetical protein [Cupriavidus sp. UGS-1]|uniref:hypothetical protein n=1 Tax=Cupriavidus sp. UGS-1 TaxID=2899826 RepID=UPI001E4E8733|nr:hypothetical protein [Cupriavidus sp. UGS-1]MCD9120382.1 hypothetical protein [Cupriavidus sp. UGS-1]
MAVIHGAGAPPPIMTCNIARKMASEKTNQINNLPGSNPGASNIAPHHHGNRIARYFQRAIILFSIIIRHSSEAAQHSDFRNESLLVKTLPPLSLDLIDISHTL